MEDVTWWEHQMDQRVENRNGLLQMQTYLFGNSVRALFSGGKDGKPFAFILTLVVLL